MTLLRHPSKRRTDEAIKQVGNLWTDTFGTLATRALQIIVVVTVAIGVTIALQTLALVTIPVLIALILASAMYPVVGWLRRHRVPSALAALITLLGTVVVLGFLTWLIVVAVVNQWENLRDSAVEGFTRLQAFAATLPISFGDEQLNDATNAMTDFLTSAQFSNGALAGVSATANFFAGFVLMAVVLFFFLKDGPQIWEFLLRPFKGHRHTRSRRVGERIVSTLGGYVRGTSTVAAVDAIGIGIGLVIVGVPLAVPLAVVVFIAAFIPLVGAIAAGILATLVALVTLGPVQALIVVGIVVLVNQLEGNLLQPILMGRTLNLHGLVVLVGLAAGTVLGDVVGAVLSVPLLAAAWGAVQVWNETSQPVEIPTRAESRVHQRGARIRS